MKAVTIRMPDELLNALRKKAAEETIRQNRQVSINTLAVEILKKAVGKKKGG
jgi:predicted DNA binding CopG/RHH family protein